MARLGSGRNKTIAVPGVNDSDVWVDDDDNDDDDDDEVLGVFPGIVSKKGLSAIAFNVETSVRPVNEKVLSSC